MSRTIQLPKNNSIIVPDNISDEQAIAYAKEKNPSIFLPDEPPPEPAKPEPGITSEIGSILKSGAGQGIAGLGKLGQYAGIGGKGLEEYGSGMTKSATEALSPGTQAALQRQFLQAAPEGKGFFGYQLGDAKLTDIPAQALQTIPVMAGTVAAAAGATLLAPASAVTGVGAGVLGVLGRVGLGKVAGRITTAAGPGAGAAESLAGKLAINTLAGNVGEGLAAAGISGIETEKAINDFAKLNPDGFFQSPIGQQALQDVDGDKKKAIELGAFRAGRSVAALTGLSTAVLATPGSAFEALAVFGKGAKAGRLRNAIIGGVTEGPGQELPQGSAEQYIQNLQRIQAGEPISPGKGVLEAGVQGAIIGAPIGGALGAITGSGKAQEPTPLDAQFRELADQYQKKGLNATDAYRTAATDIEKYAQPGATLTVYDSLGRDIEATVVGKNDAGKTVVNYSGENFVLGKEFTVSDPKDGRYGFKKGNAFVDLSEITKDEVEAELDNIKTVINQFDTKFAQTKVKTPEHYEAERQATFLDATEKVLDTSEKEKKPQVEKPGKIVETPTEERDRLIKESLALRAAPAATPTAQTFTPAPAAPEPVTPTAQTVTPAPAPPAAAPASPAAQTVTEEPPSTDLQASIDAASAAGQRATTEQEATQAATESVEINENAIDAEAKVEAAEQDKADAVAVAAEDTATTLAKSTKAEEKAAAKAAKKAENDAVKTAEKTRLKIYNPLNNALDELDLMNPDVGTRDDPNPERAQIKSGLLKLAKKLVDLGYMHKDDLSTFSKEIKSKDVDLTDSIGTIRMEVESAVGKESTPQSRVLAKQSLAPKKASKRKDTSRQVLGQLLTKMREARSQEYYAKALPRVTALIYKRMNQMGLGKYVSNEFLASMKNGNNDEVNGEYIKRLIKLAIAGKSDNQIMSTLDHEAIHAMRAIGMITDEEWKNLKTLVDKRGWMATFLIQSQYDKNGKLIFKGRYENFNPTNKELKETGLNREQWILNAQYEEAIADAFSTYANGRSPVLGYDENNQAIYRYKKDLKLAGQPVGIINRILRILRIIKEVASEDAVFKRLEAAPIEADADKLKAEGASPKLSVAKDNQKFSVAPRINTDAFKRWFGDSKVVDENGEPLVVYHGTPYTFVSGAETGIFNTKDFGALLGKGAYFTRNATEAENYAGKSASGAKPNIIPAYVSIKNPFIATSVLNKVPKRNELKQQGYDGVILKENGKVRWAVAFEPTQIKSSIGNTGAFDSTNPDIRRSVAPRITKNIVKNAKGLYIYKGKLPESFYKWFGKSAVTDDDGYPLVMFHGTARDITEFKPKQANAIFVTTDTQLAFNFSELSRAWVMEHLDDFITPERQKEIRVEAGKVEAAATEQNKKTAFIDELDRLTNNELKSENNLMPLFVRAENPFDYEDKKHIDAIRKEFDKDSDLSKEETNLIFDSVQKGRWQTIELKKVQDAIRATGFDGFFAKEEGEKNLAVYDPNQVKSVTGNSGEYSRESKDIRRSVAPLLDTSSLVAISKVANSRAWDTGRNLKIAIQDTVTKAAEQDGIDLSSRDQKTKDYLVKATVQDGLYALQQNKSAIGWYDLKTRQALAVMSIMYPELRRDQNAKLAFIWALAVSSNGQKVLPNFRMASKIYKEYKQTGRMPENIGTGQAGKAINKGLRRFNQLKAQWGIDKLRKFSLTDFTVGEITSLSQDLKPDGEHAATVVRGSAILGPKVGNGFFSNLYGMFDSLTMDRWLIRSWGRWSGTLLVYKEEQTQTARTRLNNIYKTLLQNTSEAKRLSGLIKSPIEEGISIDDLAKKINKASQKPETRAELNATEFGSELRLAGNSLTKYLDAQKEAPANADERNFIREVFNTALKEIRLNPNYSSLQMADLQAVLWYAEKRLYETAKKDEVITDENDIKDYNDDEAPDYANAAAIVAEENDVPKAKIQRTLREEENARRTAAARPSSEGQNYVRPQQFGQAIGFVGREKTSFIRTVAVLDARSNRRDTQESSYAYERKSGAADKKPRLLKKLDVRYVAEWNPGKKLKNIYNRNRINTPTFLELDKTEDSAAKFAGRLNLFKYGNKDTGAAVSVYPNADYANMRMFLSEDGRSGFAIKDDGDIVSVFSGNGAGHSIVSVAVEAGGIKLDAYDTVLPNIYDAHGFEAVSRIKWGDTSEGKLKETPPGWNKKAMDEFNNGEPDVVFMIYNPDYYGEYSGKDGKLFTGDTAYNRATLFQNRELNIKQEATNGRRYSIARSSLTSDLQKEGAVDPRLGDRGEGREKSGRFAPLKMAPSVKSVNGPDRRIVEVAERYTEENGFSLKRQAEYVLVDKARGKRLADAYLAMPHAPQDPVVKEAYSNLIKQTTAQYRALEAAGYRFWFIDLNIKENLDYLSSPWNAIRDLRANQEMGVFPTTSGFGTEEFDTSNNPLLANTGIEWPNGGLDGPLKPVLANDLFRAVHDAFGHGLEGAGFRADGEENAFQAHIRMYTGSAKGAVTSETRGQNSEVNFGPNGEFNRTASAADTIFADQKTGLMPQWTWTEAIVKDELDQDEELNIKEEVPNGRRYSIAGSSLTSDLQKEGAVAGEGIHYSQQERGSLSSKYFGTGYKGAELARVAEAKDPRIKQRIYFYVNGGKGIRPEKYVGGVGHRARLENLYDIESDTLDIVNGNSNEDESAILDAGFDGYASPSAGVAVLLGKRTISVELVTGKAEVPLIQRSEIGSMGKISKAFGKNQSLPSGQMTGAQWKVELQNKAPELVAMIDLNKIQDDKKYYKNDIWRSQKDAVSKKSPLITNDEALALQEEGVQNASGKYSHAMQYPGMLKANWPLVPETNFYRENSDRDDIAIYKGKFIQLPWGDDKKSFGMDHILHNAIRQSNRRWEQVTNKDDENAILGIIDILSAKDLKVFKESPLDNKIIIRSGKFKRAIILGENKDDLRIISVVPSEMPKFGKIIDQTPDVKMSDEVLFLYENNFTGIKVNFRFETPPATVTIKKTRSYELPKQSVAPRLNLSPYFGATGALRGNAIPTTFAAPASSKLTDHIYTWADKFVDLKNLQKEIESTIGQLEDQYNAYRKEELYHAKVAKQVLDFMRLEVRPLFEAMKEENITSEKLNEYIHNRHAEERNDQIDEINKGLVQGLVGRGSGISTTDADTYLNNLTTQEKASLDRVARMLDGIMKDTRALMVSSGLEEQGTIDAWERTYTNYVPLERVLGDPDEENTGFTGQGQGFSVSKNVKRALGSTLDVEHIIANILATRERTIVRAEKNEVNKALYGLAIKAPNPNIWIAVDPELPKGKRKNLASLLATFGGFTINEAKNIAAFPQTRSIDRQTGLITKGRNPQLAKADNVLHLMIDGKEKLLFFNSRNQQANRLIRTLKNLDTANFARGLQTVGAITRYFSAVNTQYNPIFGVINLIRDVQSGLINLESTPIAGMQKQVASDFMPAIKGIWSQLRAEAKGGNGTGPWAALFKDFEKYGGPTGYRDMFANAGDRARMIESEMKALNRGKIKSGFVGIGNMLSDYNIAFENGVRLAAYKAAIDKGFSEEKAASLAKNLTVNFNRKGDIGLQAGALYAFFNASVQGTARILQTMTKIENGKIVITPLGNKIIRGGLLLGVVQAVALAAAGFDDDNPPQFVREKNFVIPLMNGKYLTVPMPLGFNLLPNLSRNVTEWGMSGFKNTPKRITSLLESVMTGLNPFGGGFSVQTLVPTVVDPLMALAENKDSFGRKIAREDFSSLRETPGYLRTKETATPWSKGLSEFLNYASGGTQHMKGAFSPTPDQIDYLIGQATGGVGREIGKISQTVSSAVTGEELPSTKIPLASRFYGDTEESASQSNKYYTNLSRINAYAAEIKGRIAKPGTGTVMEFIKDVPEARLVPLATATYSSIQKIEKLKKEAINRNLPKERIRQLEKLAQDRMKQFNKRVTAFQ